MIQPSFSGLLVTCAYLPQTTFPDGVTGMDSYDDVLPEGLPSYATFLESLETKKVEYQAKNVDAIPAAVEQVKADSKRMFQETINKAVEKAIEDIVMDLSDDQLPYLEEDAMQALREELVAAAKEYGATRIES